MAYVLNDKENEQNQNPVLSSGGAPMAQPQQLQVNSQQPQQNQAKTQGSGFVNLERMLTGAAQQQQQQRIKSARDQVLGDQRKEFENAYSGLKNYADTAAPTSKDQVKSLFDSNADQSIKDIYERKQTGPQVDYQKSKDIEDRVRMLGDVNTATRATMSNPDAPSYSFGARNLDQALLTGDDNSKNLVNDIRQQGRLAEETQNQYVKNINDKIKEKQDLSIRAATDALKEIQRQKEAQTDARIADWENERTQYGQYRDDVNQFAATDPLAKYVTKDARNLEGVKGAINEQELATFERLKSLLGDEYQGKEYNTKEELGRFADKRAPVYSTIEQKNAWGGNIPKKAAYSPAAHKAERALLSPEQNAKVDELVKWMQENNSEGKYKLDWQNIYKWAETGDPAYIASVANTDPYRWSFDPKNVSKSRQAEDPQKYIGKKEGWIEQDPEAYT